MSTTNQGLKAIIDTALDEAKQFRKDFVGEIGDQGYGMSTVSNDMFRVWFERMAAGYWVPGKGQPDPMTGQVAPEYRGGPDWVRMLPEVEGSDGMDLVRRYERVSGLREQV